MSMHAEDTEAFRKIIAADPECKQCFECGSPNPQWCDINHGIFVCLECSGVHRSLGVHLSFVRSSTMDSWTSWRPEKLRQMQLGGNRRARLYFESHGVPKSPIKARYESEGALKYASLLEAEALGQPFNEAAWQPPEWYTRMRNQSQQAQQSQPSSMGGGYGSPHNASPNAHMENRFTGMGSGPAPSRSTGAGASGSGGGGGGDWFAAVSSGWGALTQKASALAQTAQESLAQTDVEGLKTSVARGWGSVTSAVAAYTTQAGEENDGLAALQQKARQERAAQTQQSAMPGRFDHIEHIASPTQTAPTTVASGWGGPTASTAAAPRPTNAWGVASAPTTASNQTGSPLVGRVTGVAESRATGTATGSSNGTVLSGHVVGAVAQQPLPKANHKKDDDWGWDDDEEE